jgi:enoyl-CoA hydratase
MNFDNLLVNYEDGIATVTLHRPKALNALNQDLYRNLLETAIQLENNPDVKVVILTGGEKVFGAGADIKFMLNANPTDILDFIGVGREATDKWENLSKPVIAVVHGYALGGGCELALACDFRIASETAKFGLPEINIGVFPGGGGTQRLPRLIGAARAKELVMTGDFIDGNVAHEYGLVNKVVPEGEVMKEAVKLAQKLMSKGSVSLRMAKEAINTGISVDLQSGLTMEKNFFALLFSTEDQKEGMKAFVEKRKPHFQGK